MSDTPSAAEMKTRLLAAAPAHMKPLVDAAVSGLAGLYLLKAGSEPVSGANQSLGAVAIFRDDFGTSQGPDAFAGLHEVFCRATRISVMAGPIDLATYFDAALDAVLRRAWVVIVETRPAHRQPWLSRARDLARGAQIIDVPFRVGTVH